ncbi:DUF3159 domain-containing protein [Actinomycetospora sp. OC33-EN08]|uniref:DUF3159 domain-containing protein n=1 Tax=Actinomycetospora aurantiaca TaxID=3129233 RepID=A0ABU8MRP7_9PSEU
MNATRQPHDDASICAAPTTPKAPKSPSVLEQMGGRKGFVYSTIPVLVFVAANAFLPLSVTIAISLAVGFFTTVIRLVRGEKVAQAIGSLLGVGVAVAIVGLTGSAKDFFVIGIWASAAGFVVTAGSLVARRPVTGLVWNLLHGGKHRWRADGPALRAHDVATLAAALVFGARFVVQQWLYLTDATGGLGVARIAMGTPLTVLGALVVVWAFRRSSKRLLPKN